MYKFLYSLPLSLLGALLLLISPAQAAGISPAVLAPGDHLAKVAPVPLGAAAAELAENNIVQVHRRWRGRHRFRVYRRFRPRIYIRIPHRRYYHYRGCGWLKRKAYRTGSRYWWRRYNHCRWG